MSLNEVLLAKLANWKPAASRTSLTVADEATGWSATATVDESNTLSCLLWDLHVRRAADEQKPSSDELKAWTERIAQDATGLLENLRVVEIDLPRGQAQLRSEQPAQRGDEVFYYEVLLSGARDAHLRRFRASQSHGRREQVVFPVTNEALAKIVSVITAN
jgi:hypothetical protein